MKISITESREERKKHTKNKIRKERRVDKKRKERRWAKRKIGK